MFEPEPEPEVIRLREAQASDLRASPAAKAGSSRAAGAPASGPRTYAVARCVGAEHLEGQVLTRPWAEVLTLLPGGRLQRGRTYIRGFDSPAAARAWLAAELPLQARRRASASSRP